jgi:hypothetical protein
MTATRYIIVGLAIGLLAFGAANAWAAAEFNAIKVYDLFKFIVEEADDWSQSGKGNQIEYECIDDTDGCEVEVLGVGVGGGRVINIRYTCDFGAKLLLHPSGILIIQNDCDGAQA